MMTFDASRSSDPDGDQLTYEWDFGDGTTSSFTLPNATHRYSRAGNFPVRLMVSDGRGGTDSTTRVVTIVSREATPCELAQASPAFLWPPNHKLVLVSIIGVTGPENEAVTLTITGVTQDEPVHGRGDGETRPDAVLQDAEEVVLRAERSGTGNGRVYRITFTVDDGVGGECTGSVTVCVPHHQRRAPCRDDGQHYDSLLP
jgi:PKD repeat protein